MKRNRHKDVHRRTPDRGLHRRLVSVSLVVAGVAVIAVLTMRYSGAATFSLSLEAESGTVQGAAAADDRAGASGSRTVTFGGGGTPSGPTLYVAAGGNDASAGTSAALPKRTIGAALSASSPGYTILVAPGTYDGNVVIDKGGTAGKPITIRSVVKHGAIISGNTDGNESGIEITKPYVRIQDFTVTGASGSGIRNGIMINADNVEVAGNHIYNICQFLTGDTGWEGGAGVDIWKSPSANILIDGNLIHHIGAPGSTQQLVHGMYLASHVTNGRVTNNVIYNVEDFGLHPYDQTEASGWQFINNTIANTGRGILQAPNGVTRNNIVYNTRGARYDIRGSGNVVSNNIAGGTGTGTGTGVTSADPMFVNAGANDYRLKQGSPAIDKGTSTGAPAADYLGIRRPQGAGIDIGAFEQ